MKIFAHRGASGDEPENTLLAIKLALTMPVGAIEVDVHRVEDQLVVIHDRWVQKTTNGHGRLSNMSLEQVQQLDAGKGQQVPTLWQVMSVIGGRCEVNIEIKSDGCDRLLANLLDSAVKQLNFSHTQFLVSSFNHHFLKRFKRIRANIDIGALIATRQLDYANFAVPLNAYSVHIDIDVINQAFVDDAHQRGLKVYVYTVDHELDIVDMLNLGVDGLFTNFPERTAAVLKSQSNYVR